MTERGRILESRNNRRGEGQTLKESKDSILNPGEGPTGLILEIERTDSIVTLAIQPAPRARIIKIPVYRILGILSSKGSSITILQIHRHYSVGHDVIDRRTSLNSLCDGNTRASFPHTHTLGLSNHV